MTTSMAVITGMNTGMNTGADITIITTTVTINIMTTRPRPITRMARMARWIMARASPACMRPA